MKKIAIIALTFLIAPAFLSAVYAETKKPEPSKKFTITRIYKFIVTAPYKGKVLAGKQAKLLDFNLDDYKNTLKTDKLIVLYFDDQDPEFANLSAAFDETPVSNVIGIRVKLSAGASAAEKEMAKTFKVASSHTKVFIRNAKTLLNTSKSFSKDDFLKQINSFLR